MEPILKPQSPNRNPNNSQNTNLDPGQTAVPTPIDQPQLPPEPPKPKRSKGKKALIIILILLLISGLAAAGYFFLYKAEPKTTTNNSTTTPDYLVSDLPVFCASLGHSKLQCQNVDTGEVAKFTLPKGYNDIRSIQPSPDGTKYVLSNYSKDSYDSILLDSKFAKVKTLSQAEIAGDVSYFWVGSSSDKLVRSTTVDNGSNKTTQTIDIVDLKTGKTTNIYKSDKKFYTVVGANDQLIFVTSIVEVKPGDEDSQAKPDEMSAITISDKSINKIDASSVYNDANGKQEVTSSATVAYRADNDMFYINSESAQDTANKKVFKIAKLSGDAKALKLTAVSNQDLAFAYGAVGPVFTTKGVFTDTAKDGITSYPLTLMTANNAKTELKLGHGGQWYYFSAKAMPELSKSSKSEPETADFISEPKGTSAKVHKFLEELVTKGCKENNYVVVTLRENDGDKQLATSEGGCEKGAAYYYIYKDGAYKQVAATQEGMSCEERDKLGLTAVVVPECRKPGDEGL